MQILCFFLPQKHPLSYGTPSPLAEPDSITGCDWCWPYKLPCILATQSDIWWFTSCATLVTFFFSLVVLCIQLQPIFYIVSPAIVSICCSCCHMFFKLTDPCTFMIGYVIFRCQQLPNPFSLPVNHKRTVSMCVGQDQLSTSTGIIPIKPSTSTLWWQCVAVIHHGSPPPDNFVLGPQNTSGALWK